MANGLFATHPGSLLSPEGLAPGVNACMTERAGGLSVPPFDSMNLGDHVGDAPEHVAANRAQLAQRLGHVPVYLQQVHGVNVVEIKAKQQMNGLPLVADACWSSDVGAVCTIMVADCLPMLLTTEDGSSVAAVHAGWRSLAGQGGVGVLEQLFQCWPAAALSAQRSRLRVWLGPCIGPQAFEVGPDVYEAFTAHHSAAAQHFSPQPGVAAKFAADLSALARQRLQTLGVVHISGNDSSPKWCTYSNPSRFFSHRRDARLLGGSGRMAACIWRA
jgi:polyphenol oxidase